MKQIPNLSRAALLSLALAAAGEIVAASPATPSAPVAVPAMAQSAVFARVGDSVITQDEYNAAFNGATRSKFYHGKPPDSEIAVLQREVSDQLVTRILLQREAKRRGLRPDDAEIQKTVQSYEQRYAGSEQWKKNRAQMLPPLVLRLGQDSLLSQIEKTVRTGVKPSEKEAKAYYAAHQDQFTEPEQLRVSVILLKVDPSSPAATWKKAEEQAQALAKRLRGGEDFATLARQLSADESAKQGGDMGYLHSGMLPDGTQEVLAKMKAGEITDSVRLLQGQAVFRLTDRKAAKLHEFEAAKVRVQELVQREQSDRAWTAFVADLKTKTPPKIDQSRFLPLTQQSNARATPK
jgi:parvulin-like peptidyl-prolyl isomerase